MSQQQAVTKKKALVYRSADRAGKTRILDCDLAKRYRCAIYVRFSYTVKVPCNWDV